MNIFKEMTKGTDNNSSFISNRFSMDSSFADKGNGLFTTVNDKSKFAVIFGLGFD